MRQTTKKNKIPTYCVIQLLSIVFLLNVVQCKCDKGKGVEDPKLSLAGAKDSLVGSDTTTTVTITNSTETIADLSKYGLLAEIKQGSGKVKCGDVALSSAQALKALLDSAELGKESKDFNITLKPADGATEFELALSIVEIDSNNTVDGPVTVKWSAGGLAIDLTKSKLEVVGDDTATIVVSNTGDATVDGDVKLVVERLAQKVSSLAKKLSKMGLTKQKSSLGIPTGAVYDIIEIERKKEVSLKAIASGGEVIVNIPIKGDRSPKEFIVSLKQGSRTVASTKIKWERNYFLDMRSRTKTTI